MESSFFVQCSFLCSYNIPNNLQLFTFNAASKIRTTEKKGKPMGRKVSFQRVQTLQQKVVRKQMFEVFPRIFFYFIPENDI